MTTVGRAVASELRALGVEVIFGIPGVHTIELYRGLAESGIRMVTPRHEQGAGFMADAYARVTGRPGVCVAITGPGVLNAMTPIAQAWHDSVPLLVVTSTTSRADLGRGRGALHDVPDQAEILRSLTNMSETVTDARSASEAVRRAWDSLGEGRPRPVHLAFPVDVLAASEATGRTLDVAKSSSLAPPTQAVTEAVALLAKAERPIVLIGGGAVDAGEPAIALAERLNAPVVLTGNAKGTVPSSHPLCLGSTLPFRSVQREIAEADVAIAVGTEFSEVDVAYGERPLQFGGKLIRIDIDPTQLHEPFSAAVALVGDACATLAAIVDMLGPRPSGEAWASEERVQAARAALDWTPESLSHMPWLSALDAVLPSDRIVALDSTQLAYTAHHWMPAEQPRSWLAPYGLGTLGPALPMAIGAKVAAPDRPVVAIVGDGGLLFTIAELATAVDLGLALPIVVWDNGGYGEIRDAFDRAAAPRVGTETSLRDVLAVARGFGCATAEAADPAALARAVSCALKTPGPTVIRVPVDG